MKTIQTTLGSPIRDGSSGSCPPRRPRGRARYGDDRRESHTTPLSTTVTGPLAPILPADGSGSAHGRGAVRVRVVECEPSAVATCPWRRRRVVARRGPRSVLPGGRRGVGAGRSGPASGGSCSPAGRGCGDRACLPACGPGRRGPRVVADGLAAVVVLAARRPVGSSARRAGRRAAGCSAAADPRAAERWSCVPGTPRVRAVPRRRFAWPRGCPRRRWMRVLRAGDARWWRCSGGAWRCGSPARRRVRCSSRAAVQLRGRGGVLRGVGGVRGGRLGRRAPAVAARGGARLLVRAGPLSRSRGGASRGGRGPCGRRRLCRAARRGGRCGGGRRSLLGGRSGGWWPRLVRGGRRGVVGGSRGGRGGGWAAGAVWEVRWAAAVRACAGGGRSVRAGSVVGRGRWWEGSAAWRGVSRRSSVRPSASLRPSVAPVVRVSTSVRGSRSPVAIPAPFQRPLAPPVCALWSPLAVVDAFGGTCGHGERLGAARPVAAAITSRTGTPTRPPLIWANWSGEAGAGSEPSRFGSAAASSAASPFREQRPRPSRRAVARVAVAGAVPRLAAARRRCPSARCPRRCPPWGRCRDGRQAGPT
jgi:hypothetical protein